MKRNVTSRRISPAAYLGITSPKLRSRFSACLEFGGGPNQISKLLHSDHMEPRTQSRSLRRAV
jgi:hypothetical protein